MPSDPAASILSVLMKPNPANDPQSLIEALMSIQTQLSIIQENQRKIMKTLRTYGLEQRNRMTNLKKITETLVKNTHDELVEKIDEIQDIMDDHYEDFDLDEEYMSPDLDLFNKK